MKKILLILALINMSILAGGNIKIVNIDGKKIKLKEKCFNFYKYYKYSVKYNNKVTAKRYKKLIYICNR